MLKCGRSWVSIGICWFSAKHAALRSKSKDWLARNQDNVSEWCDMSIQGLLFHWASTIKILTRFVDLVQSWYHHFIVTCEILLYFKSYITTNVVSSNPTQSGCTCSSSVVFSGYSRFPPSIKLTARYNWNIVVALNSLTFNIHSVKQYFVHKVNTIIF